MAKRCYICKIKKSDKKFKKQYRREYGIGSYTLSAICKECLRKETQLIK